MSSATALQNQQIETLYSGMLLRSKKGLLLDREANGNHLTVFIALLKMVS